MIVLNIAVIQSLFNYYVSKLGLTKAQLEAISNILLEDAASDATKRTKKVIREVCKQFSHMLDDVATDDNGNPITTLNGKTQTVIEYLERNVRNTYFHNGKSNIKFEPGVARIAYGELGMQAHEDSHNLRILGKKLFRKFLHPILINIITT